MDILFRAMGRRGAVVLVLLLGLAPVAANPAAAQSAGWGRTSGGCQVWDPWGGGEALAWSGGCAGGPGGGKASGKGQLRRGTGRTSLVFEGTLREGKAQGEGRIGWPDGSLYTGSWRDGQRSGQGEQVFANGNRYEGAWRAEVPHGRGTLTTSTGLRYEGDWKDGQRTGQGVFSMRDGTRYTGGFLNGRQEGQGTQVFANGSRYEGAWRNGLPNGPGVGYGAVTGRVFRGIFVNGCLRTAEFVAAFGVADTACR